MRLTIRHETIYRYDVAASYALLQLRVRPRATTSQRVVSWKVELDGAQSQANFADQYANQVDLAAVLPEREDVRITVEGVVETSDQSGVVGDDPSHVPLWLYRRPTALTRSNDAIQTLGRAAQRDDTLSALHTLSQSIKDAVTYSPGETGTHTTAADALRHGSGVCQDHTHIFLSAARSLGIPARYVGGYLMMDDREQQDAGHAWAEAHIAGLGWVGFDVSNGISPDARYVSVARGLDYSECAPIRGIMFGAQKEALEVSIQVQQ